MPPEVQHELDLPLLFWRCRGIDFRYLGIDLNRNDCDCHDDASLTPNDGSRGYSINLVIFALLQTERLPAASRVVPENLRYDIS